MAVVRWIAAIPSLLVEILDQVALDVLQPVGVALEVWEVLLLLLFFFFNKFIYLILAALCLRLLCAGFL